GRPSIARGEYSSPWSARESENTMPHPDRRQVLGALAGAGATLLTPDARAAGSLIRAENDKPGTLDWQLTYTRVDPRTKWRSPLIEGYAGRQSVRAGEKIERSEERRVGKESRCRRGREA